MWNDVGSMRERSGFDLDWALGNGNIVVAISRSNTTTFHQFASLFKLHFERKNAPYLDIAISKLYLSTLRPDEPGGDVGVMISVTEK